MNGSSAAMQGRLPRPAMELTMPSPRVVFALLLLALPALPLLPAAAVAQGPAEAYRAWWSSGLTPADPGSERFRSRASILELADFRSEEPETAAETIAFMAEAHRTLVEAATLGRIETVHEDAGEALLHVVLNGRDGPLPAGMPSEARVRMVREEDGWKVDTESFTGAGFGGRSDTPAGPDEACPANAVLGDPDSPNRLVVFGTDGHRTVHPGAAYLLRDGDALTLHLPRFDENLLTIVARAGGNEPGSHVAMLAGTRWSGGCPALPDALVHGDAPAGRLEWQRLDDAASARVSFAFPDPGSDTLLLSGNLDAVPFLDASPGPMGPGSVMVTLDGQEIVPDRGLVVLHEGEARLEIMLGFVRSDGGGSTSVSVPEFLGEPGVYPGASWFDSREVTVVRVFDGSRIELEVREIATNALPGGVLDADEVLGMGELKARVVTDRLVRLPALPTVGGA
jgi:hypothetical protein